MQWGGGEGWGVGGLDRSPASGSFHQIQSRSRDTQRCTTVPQCSHQTLESTMHKVHMSKTRISPTMPCHARIWTCRSISMMCRQAEIGAQFVVRLKFKFQVKWNRSILFVKYFKLMSICSAHVSCQPIVIGIFLTFTAKVWACQSLYVIHMDYGIDITCKGMEQFPTYWIPIAWQCEF